MQVGMAVKNAIKNTKKLEQRMPVKEKKVRDKGLLARTNYAQEEEDNIPDSLRLKLLMRELFNDTAG